MESEEFAKFLAAVRAGDVRAAEELARRFEPDIRRVARMRLHDVRLRRVLDTTDVCQSILRRFLAHARSGEFDLDTPEQLAALLTRMTINKIITVARRTAREAGSLPPEWDPIDPAPSPLQQLLRAELVETARRHLAADDLALFEAHYVQQREWAEIAAERGGCSPQGLRMRLARALAHVRAILEDEEPTHVA
jgi:RNA polymerase sigma factor (sigma-70 family)